MLMLDDDVNVMWIEYVVWVMVSGLFVDLLVW